MVRNIINRSRSACVQVPAIGESDLCGHFPGFQSGYFRLERLDPLLDRWTRWRLADRYYRCDHCNQGTQENHASLSPHTTLQRSMHWQPRLADQRSSRHSPLSCDDDYRRSSRQLSRQVAKKNTRPNPGCQIDALAKLNGFSKKVQPEAALSPSTLDRFFFRFGVRRRARRWRSRSRGLASSCPGTLSRRKGMI